jgi:hypothetical protein
MNHRAMVRAGREASVIAPLTLPAELREPVLARLSHIEHGLGVVASAGGRDEYCGGRDEDAQKLQDRDLAVMTVDSERRARADIVKDMEKTSPLVTCSLF